MSRYTEQTILMFLKKQAVETISQAPHIGFRIYVWELSVDPIAVLILTESFVCQTCAKQ